MEFKLKRPKEMQVSNEILRLNYEVFKLLSSSLRKLKTIRFAREPHIL